MSRKIEDNLSRNWVSLSEREINILNDIIWFFKNKTYLLLNLWDEIQRLWEFIRNKWDSQDKKVIIATEVSGLKHDYRSESDLIIWNILKEVKYEKWKVEPEEDVTIIIHELLREYVDNIDTILKIWKSIKEFWESIKNN